MKKILLALGAAAALWSVALIAADHNDPPEVAGGLAEDIGDLYAWHFDDNGTQKMVAVLTFAGPVAPTQDQAGLYDPDMLYGIHIDTDDEDNEANHELWVRFGTNNEGATGVQVLGVPGATGPVVGPVEATITDGDVKVFAGLRDDPFFMDLDGFVTTVTTGTLSFDSNNDSFAGQNITSVVIEMPFDAVKGGAGDVVNIWSTASRIGE